MFSCWILLLIAQVTLVSVGPISRHKRLGIFGMIRPGLLALVGFMTLIGAVRRHAVFGMGLDALFGEDVLQLSVFAVPVFWALRARVDAPAHKRLMIRDGCTPGTAISPLAICVRVFEPFVFFVIFHLFLIFMIAFDFWSRRKIHRGTILGSLLILIMQVTMIPVGRLRISYQATNWIQHL